MTPLVSFVIPVRNDAERLDRCLQTIRANDYPADRLEIVVVDNGSVDGSPAVAERHRARVIVIAGAKVGSLRNSGVKAATGDVIAFVDADHEIVPGWVRCAVEVLADTGVGVVGADCSPPPAGTRVQRLYDRLRRHSPGLYEVDWLGSGNMALRRADFERVAGFDTSLETCEDVDLCRKLRGLGQRVMADSRLHNIHYGDPDSLRRVFFGELWRGRDNVRVSLRPPRSGRILASAIVPVVNVILLATLVAGLVTASTTGLVVGAIAAGLIALQWVARATAMTASHGFREWFWAGAVAAAYEMGRACAIVVRISHGKRRQDAATS